MGQAVKEFTSGNPNEPFTSWMRKWPDVDFVRYLTYFNSDALLVISLAAQKEILGKHCYSFAKPTLYFKLASDIVGKGVGVAEGQEHRNQRPVLNSKISKTLPQRCTIFANVLSLLVGLFSLTNLKKYIPVFRNKARDLTKLFEQAIDNNDGYVTRKEPF